jgi:putative glutamine amidotransferase
MSPVAYAAVSMRTSTSGHGELRDAMSDDLIAFVDRSGFAPLLIPNRPAAARELLAHADLIVLSGGGEPLSASGTGGDRRALTERLLLDHALAHRLPVLGICRGAQVINARFGGVTCAIGSRSHAGTEHGVHLAPSRLEKLFGGVASLTVNSFHDHGLDRLGAGLVAVATAGDGQVEAIEHVEHPLVGVMWHPERTCTDPAFAEAHAGFLRRLVMAERGGS